MKKLAILSIIFCHQFFYAIDLSDLKGVPGAAEILASINASKNLNSMKDRFNKRNEQQDDKDAKIEFSFAYDVCKEYELTGSTKRKIIELFRHSGLIKRQMAALGYDTRLVVAKTHICLDGMRQDQFELMLTIINGAMMPALLKKQLMGDKYTIEKLEQLLASSLYLEIQPLTEMLQEILVAKKELPIKE